MNKYASLTPDQLAILRDKGTEPPQFGHVYHATRGTFLCRGCGAPLFRAAHQFSSGCGWPSFDDELPQAVMRLTDADGHRTEILCAHCHSHLGHVFLGEGFTAKNCRHCVNSVSLEWVEDEHVLTTQEAFVAGGCFWGVEHWVAQLPGVLKTEVGYMGGHTQAPSYHDVCGGDTGHLESLRVVFDPKRLSYAALLRFFFEIHDPTQTDGQGPDLGPQYASAIFYYPEQQSEARAVCQQLADLGYAVATQLHPVSVFWPAEDYHQQYYRKTGKHPYCHRYQKKF